MLFTPPLVPEGQNLLDCYLVDISQRRREATIEVRNRDGGSVASLTVVLDPGAERVVTSPATDSPETAPKVLQVLGRRSSSGFPCLYPGPGTGPRLHQRPGR